VFLQCIRVARLCRVLQYLLSCIMYPLSVHPCLFVMHWYCVKMMQARIICQPYNSGGFYWIKFIQKGFTFRERISWQGLRNIEIFSLKVVVCPKWCKLGPRLLLITSSKSHPQLHTFDWYHNQWTWMTLNVVLVHCIALCICHYVLWSPLWQFEWKYLDSHKQQQRWLNSKAQGVYFLPV